MIGSEKKSEVENSRHSSIEDGGNLLYIAIEERNWKSALSRMQHSPHEVSTFVYRVDPNSRRSKFKRRLLPLHCVCMRRPPSLIVSALLASYPQAVEVKCDGKLPLHFAVKYGASLEAIQMLVIAFPNALKMVDSSGKNPMTIFGENKEKWKTKEKKDSIKRLLKEGVNAVIMDESVAGTKSFKSEMGVADDDDAMEEEKDMLTTLNEEGWKTAGLAIIVVGASGDLAKKKTYPSLLYLFNDDLLPEDTIICGYARSQMSHEDLRNKLRPFLEKTKCDGDVISKFLSMCYYSKGASYGDADAFKRINDHVSSHEAKFPKKLEHNRLFYFAIPPNVFAETGVAIKKTCMASKGWTRLIVEKPFGRDLKSCEDMLASLSNEFDESQMFRIDHYLGKEMVQNLLILRFGNLWFERMWNRDNIQCVILTFKEPFGTDGRGGYFDNYGIIRDIIQNHLLQVMTLLAMEAPTRATGPEAGENIRNAKVQVLNAISPVTLDECVLGQYEGYTDDETIKNKNTNTPTFAVARVFVNTPRWAGVPFIFKAGKALNERKAEMRIQFKDAPAATFLFDDNCPRNELVIRMQPHEAIYMKTNVKAPGFSGKPVQAELEVNYEERFFHSGGKAGSNPDAYTRLILDVLRGRSATFVREDELRRSWEIWTPLLHKIERENIQPVIYKQGSRGPVEADIFIEEKAGYKRNVNYSVADDDDDNGSASA